jgi:membrane protein YqaA with SNARE-associated domain
MRNIHLPKRTNIRWRTYIVGFIPFALFLTVSIVLNVYVSPEQIISSIGVNNAYLLIFFMAFIGGVTNFIRVHYHLVVVSMAAGGLNPFILGSSAATGVMLGDSTSYYLGHRGKEYIPKRFEKFFSRLRTLITHHSRIFPLFCFLYGTFIPFSNDFITITAGLMRYPFWKVIIPLGIGNLVFNTTIALLSSGSSDVLNHFFF